MLTARSVPLLRCAAIAGPANNQLDAPATADLLHERGILGAPTPAAAALHRARQRVRPSPRHPADLGR